MPSPCRLLPILARFCVHVLHHLSKRLIWYIKTKTTPKSGVEQTLTESGFLAIAANDLLIAAKNHIVNIGPTILLIQHSITSLV